jgi:TonB-like protein
VLLTASRRLRFSLLGIVSTVALHALLLLPLVLTLSQPPAPKPNRSGSGGNAVASAAEPVMTVVFVNEPPPTAQAPPTIDLKNLGSKGLAPKDRALLVLSLDSTPAVEADPNSEHTPDARESPGDPASHAMLYGRYVGQVQARIERAWQRPRSEIGAAQFRCRARLEQDRSGALIDVKLDHCNGTPRWQHSLLSAIRTASPLPAPPDPSVYADVLSLTFSSDAFTSGDSADGFEPAGRSVSAVTQTVQEIRSLAERAGLMHSPIKSSDGVVNLTIVGDPHSPRAAPQP